MATRCLSPPDSCAGRMSRWRSVSRTAAVISRSFGSTWSSRHLGQLAQGAADDASHRVTPVQCRVGVLEHDLDGPHLIVGAAARARLQRLAVAQQRVRAVGAWMPSTVCASVVLPLPDSPTRPTVSPAYSANRDVVQRVDVLAGLMERLADTAQLEDRRLRRDRPSTARPLAARRAPCRARDRRDGSAPTDRRAWSTRGAS